MVRPAWLRACARESPTLTPRLHCLTELFAVLHSTELLVTRDAGAVTVHMRPRSTGAVTKCRHAPISSRKPSPGQLSCPPRNDARTPGRSSGTTRTSLALEPSLGPT